MLVLALISGLRGQEAPPLREDPQPTPPAAEPGDRIRATAPSLFPQLVVGEVVWFGPDTLILERKDSVGGTIALPLDRVEEMEISRGVPEGGGTVLGTFAEIILGAAVTR